MKIAILGSGVMGSAHARAFARLPGVEIVGVSSRSLDKARQLAAQVGAQATTDDMEWVRDPQVDAISITLPTHLHKPYTIAALNLGKHVLLEKPFGLNVAECDAMMRAWRKSGKILMLAHVLRFWGEYVTVMDLIAGGSLGKPRSAYAARLSTRPAWADWFRDPEQSGGAVLDLMIHDFDVVNAIFGKPRAVYARGRQGKRGAWDHVLASIEYTGASATVEGSVMMPGHFPFTMSLRVSAEQGTVEFSSRAGGAEIESANNAAVSVFTDSEAFKLTPAAGDAYNKQVEYFVECVRNNRQPALGTPAQARLAIAVSNAARRSLETGRVMQIREKRAVKRKT